MTSCMCPCITGHATHYILPPPIRVAHIQFEPGNPPAVPRSAEGADKVVRPTRVVGTEKLERRDVELAGIPLALDGIHAVAASRDYKVNFAPRRIPPVSLLSSWCSHNGAIRVEVLTLKS